MLVYKVINAYLLEAVQRQRQKWQMLNKNKTKNTQIQEEK